MSAQESMQRGDALRKSGDLDGAIVAYTEAATTAELGDVGAMLKLARTLVKLERDDDALVWLRRIVDATESFTSWQAAAALTSTIFNRYTPTAKRTARLAVLGSYTTTQLIPMLKLAAWREGVVLETYESAYGQYRQEILDERSGLYAFKPDVVVLATHAGDIMLPELTDDPAAAVSAEVSRWSGMWAMVRDRCEAQVIQHNAAIPFDSPFGHLGARLTGSQRSLLQQFNTALGEAAGNEVGIVDCDRLASLLGTRRWFDDKYWHVAKQAVSLEALPVLARHTSVVLAAALGLSKKCLVLDLDNTLWGGVIGEDGLAGIRLGAGPDGEAFVAFQEAVLALKRKGVILAVCSKNNDADAREPFEQHPDMRIALDDIAMFVANWEPKSQNIRRIAETLNIGIDSLVFVDDNPAEREIVRQHIPDVDVITLPTDPAGYVDALSNYLMFETKSFTQDDAKKTEQYQARAKVAELESTATSLEAFYESLQMKAVIAPFDELHLPRIEQLIGKSNQFNLTTRRHGADVIRGFMSNDDCVHRYIKLADRFADHGLVSLAIAVRDGDALDLDTWLMSCRVIGRTVEDAMLATLSHAALELGCTALQGTYVPTAKNGMVKDIFERFGFAPVDATDGTTVWRYDLVANGPIESSYIQVPTREMATDDAA
ncbi:MAG: HAD-IIIC family phosphatase [Planctomycetota bacterium]